MAFELILAKVLAKAGWKVKIRDKERLEEPHVTIIKGTKCWRIGLRSGDFLDDGRWKDFPDALAKAIERHWTLLCDEWNSMYPHNLIAGTKDDDDDENN